MKKIYDGFTFFNELDLLELRLEELYDYVDYFILVESDRTFTNIPKPYHFEENKHRYSKFLDKIRHIKIESNKYDDPWANEHHQRNCIMQGCMDASPDDVIVISDVDELPRVSALANMRQSYRDIYAIYTPFFYFKFNFVSTRSDCYIPTIIAAKMSTLAELGPQTLRDTRGHFMAAPYQFEEYDCEVIEHGGWHFSYLGDNAFVKQKLRSFSHASDHTEASIEEYDMVGELTAKDTDRYFVVVDEYFPKALYTNVGKYEKYIATADTTMLECFPTRSCELYPNTD